MFLLRQGTVIRTITASERTPSNPNNGAKRQFTGDGLASRYILYFTKSVTSRGMVGQQVIATTVGFAALKFEELCEVPSETTGEALLLYVPMLAIACRILSFGPGRLTRGC
ncbi:hypothetical protein THAOC_22515 [Thalassiosira oceanica]|uniref:Uncharacterized protein n=1 Tax=Thalassiosira oceanica TaxID=159749 RepID=K0RY72_THAOC|nr:hypothetical protein THAOC_22515 [Thalassiosira oceanica]|eukprot:EJK57439.1 hypothetical protein THAOC_22515 [Thalassiosira oceanica]